MQHNNQSISLLTEECLDGVERLAVGDQFRYDGVLRGLAVLERPPAHRLRPETFGLAVVGVKEKIDETTER